MDEALLEDQQRKCVDQVFGHALPVGAVGHAVQVRDLPALDEEHRQHPLRAKARDGLRARHIDAVAPQRVQGFEGVLCFQAEVHLFPRGAVPLTEQILRSSKRGH